MKRVPRAALVAVIFAGPLACAPASERSPEATTDSPAQSQQRPDSAAVRQATERVWAEVERVAKSDSFDAIARTYTDDGVFLTDQGELRGRDSLLASFARTNAQLSYQEFAHTTTRFETDGETALEEGIARIATTPKGKPGRSRPEEGRYLAVWKRQPNGEWRYRYFVQLSAMPAPKGQETRRE